MHIVSNKLRETVQLLLTISLFSIVSSQFALVTLGDLDLLLEKKLS